MKQWLFKIAFKKGVSRLIQFIISALAGCGLVKDGLTVADISNGQLELLVSSIVAGALEILRNFLKVKYPKQFGWL